MDLQVDWAFDWKEAQKRSFFAELSMYNVHSFAVNCLVSSAKKLRFCSTFVEGDVINGWNFV